MCILMKDWNILFCRLLGSLHWLGKLQNGDTIEIEFANQKIKANFCEQQEIKGMVGILWLSKQEDIGFCYQKIRVNRIS